MKTLLATALIALVPGLALAQAQTAPAKPKAPAKATVAKKTPAKSSAKTVVAKAEPTSSRTQLKSATNQVAAGLIAARTALTPEELEIAQRVHVGQIACEMGASVSVVADPDAPGHFHVGGKGFKYHMAPVTTTTGAVRLEDHKAGAVWLQIANKSMLMDQKKGQRLADECMSPEQVVVAEAIKKTPPPSLLDTAPAK
ncbi:hypothetical protein [Simplicispira lacusdiani]|uniref:hypothetical protein n=1 Tax=Simplicispira lacusdiani TaxID=2213010 RepID=UPI000E74C4A0|nr:hypothetical protein [Simplicispira lacusdiani]